MEAVDAEFNSEGPLTRWWRAKRIILLGEPGGPMTPRPPLDDAERARNEEDRRRTLDILDRHRASIEYRAIGSQRVSEMQLSAPLWRLTPPTVSLSLQMELFDLRLAGADAVELTIRDLSPGPNCRLAEATKTVTWNVGSTSDQELFAEWVGRNRDRLVLLLRYGGSVVDNASQAPCGGGWWSRIEADVVVTLRDGDRLRFRKAIMPGRVEQPALTLVTPTRGTRQDRMAAIGWEANGTELTGGARAGISEVLSGLEQATTAHTRWPMAVLWRTIESRCWFAGAASIQHPEQVRACLQRTRRLAVIAPTADDISGLESGFHIQDAVAAGRLQTLVADPDFSNSPVSPLPQWANVRLADARVFARPVLLFMPSQNGLLARGVDAVRRRPQEAVFMALSTSGVVGSAEAPSQCQGSAPLPAPLDRPALAWYRDLSAVPVQPPDKAAQQGASVPENRWQGLSEFKTTDNTPIKGEFIGSEADRWGTRGTFRANLFCNHPVKRLVDAIRSLEKSGLFIPGRSRIPRTAVVMVEVDQKFPPIEAIASAPCGSDPTLYSAAAIRKTITDFLDAGGAVFVQPVKPAIQFDSALINSSADVLGNSPARDLDQLIGSEFRTAGRTIVILPLQDIRVDPKDIAAGIAKAVALAWQSSDRVRETTAFRPDDGFLSDRRDACSSDEPSADNHCAFDARSTFASALNRLQLAPEEYRGLVFPDDPLQSGSIETGTRTVLRRSVPVGLGRAHFLGFSPLSRSDIGHALHSPSTASQFSNPLCYLYSAGTATELIASGTGVSAPTSIGGITMLDRFARPSSDPFGEPRVDSVIVDDLPGGGLTLAVHASAAKEDLWNWRLRAADENGNAFPTGTEPVSLIFQSYDPRTGEARIRVEPLMDYRGVLTLTFTDQPDTMRTGDIKIPVAFAPRPPQFSIAESLAGLSMARSSSTSLALDSSAGIVMALTFCALLTFSPFARRWVAPLEAAYTRLARSKVAAWLPRRPAPLFSLQAALTEFGAHPGRPSAVRNAGLPAGYRKWRSGDAGRAIITSSLYALLGEQSALPQTRPRVRLKSAMEAASSLILIEGNGALLSPPPTKNPAKADFAAVMVAFLAGAVSLAHGRAEVVRVGLPDRFTQDANDLVGPVRSALDQHPSYASPNNELQTGVSAMLVYYVCDGLSLNRAVIRAMAQTVAMDGGTFRVIAITSEDDVNAAMLRRDPNSCSFEDDSETHIRTFLAIRDNGIAGTAGDLDRRGALLVAFDTGMTTQEVLQRVDETGLLR
jgi:hypothetical protein